MRMAINKFYIFYEYKVYGFDQKQMFEQKIILETSPFLVFHRFCHFKNRKKKTFTPYFKHNILHILDCYLIKIV